MNNKPMFARIRKSKTVKLLMAFTAINLVAQIAFPSFAMALTAGSASPEFSSFEPVATTDMVNDFTGDFTYNLPVLSVPGPDGGGYSMSLSYHSGGSSEEEASWVGFGWTLNPGAINRQKRGYADDFDGVTVEKYNKQYPNWTHTTSFNMNIEAASSDNEKDKKKDEKGGVKALSFLNIPFAGGGEGSGDDDDEALIQPSVSFSKSIRYNNYSGFSITNGFGVGAKGMGSLNMNRTAGETTVGFNINPIGILKAAKMKKTKKRKANIKKMMVSKAMKKDLTAMVSKRSIAGKTTSRLASNYSAWSFNAPAVPYSVAYNAGRAYNFSMSLGIEVFTLGMQFGVQGSTNYQANVPQVSTQAYGYMHNPARSEYTKIEGKEYDENTDSYGSVKNNIIEADFQIEKGSTFNKHDKNLGIPFNNADMFTATGSGVVGGFKFYHENIGHYYPPFVTNKQKILQGGVEVAIGQTIAVGLDFGLGFQSTKVQDWRKVVDNVTTHNNYANDVYMAFNGDMGGQVDYSGDDELLYATVGGGYMNRKLNLDNFNTKTDLDTDNDRKTSRVEWDPDGDGNLDFIEVTNKDGNVSKYSKPVYTKREYELTVGLTEHLTDNNSLNQGYTVYHNLKTDPLDEKTVVGQYIAQPYASTFLLEENTTFDYVDLTNDGPTSDDFGGWTKFDYRDVHSNYQYRAPYKGVIYNRGSMINGRDQSGSVSTGKKEVKYLSEIETKTHIAFFVTNNTNKTIAFPSYTSLDLDGSYIKSGLTQDLRTDGLDATYGGVAKGTHRLEKLERIVLYAKNDLSKPISTTYFNYDYSLCKGIPNTSTFSNGKLTLKKVWTESGGTIKSKIAPYQFDYNYHVYNESSITTKYPNINAGYNLLALADQNPLYQDGLLDPWGSYRLNAATRFKKMQPWVDQKDQGTSFDPAAWQLKQIKLPSGGEIHVQYEQKDYRFVQNKEAMGMVNLRSGNLAKNGYKSGMDGSTPENRYYIDLDAIGLKATNYLDPDDYKDAVEEYASVLNSYFVNRKNKLYFKMLYSYMGSSIPNLNVFRHDVDYITGYTVINNVEISDEGTVTDYTDDQIYFELGELKSNGDGKKDKTLPRYVGYQKFLTAAQRNMGYGNGATNVDLQDEGMLTEAYNDGDPDVITSDVQSYTKDILKDNTFNFFGDWVGTEVKKESIKKVCKAYNTSLSYFKIPLYHAKKGGGIRVKRLLSYDPGIAGETGDAMIYGSEYIYKNTNGLSSGVATNEPPSIREENALVGILERNKQSGWDKTFNGRDSKQFEGPIGESLLPGAQVVYERVIVKNIHSGKTTTGYAVNNYHTVKDYPMLADFSELSKDGDDPTYKKYNLNLPLGLLNMKYSKAWVTQGYLFKLNDMNGKPESQATYAGNYSQEAFKEAAYTSKTTYAYSKPGEAVETLVYNPGTNEFESGTLQLGQEEDLTMYRSKVSDVTNDFSLELDLNFLLQWPPALSINFGLSYSYTQNELSQHVTSKVIRQKSLLRSTTTTTDGVTQITKNIAFDKNTGDPVLTQTFDGYMDANEEIHTQQGVHNGHYYALNIPASWIYQEMGPKDPDFTLEDPLAATDPNDTYSNQLTASVGNVVTYGENALIDPATGGLKTGTINVSSGGSNPFNNVVNASATVYKKKWFTGLGLSNEADLDKHYYPQRTYVYRDQVVNANDNQIYNGGIISTSFDIFSWENAINPATNNEYYETTSSVDRSVVGTNSNWYSASEIIKYSPNGYPIGEQDVLGIHSAARFGYTSTLPVLVAQNAEQEQVHFIDFESGNNDFDNDLNPDFVIETSSAHSGRGSFNFSANTNQVFITSYNLNYDLLARGVSIKLWLKSVLSNNPGSIDYNKRNTTPNLQALIGGQTFNFKRVAQTGDWSLYTVDIKYFNGLAPGPYDITLGYNFSSNTEEVLIDDVRIQPLDAVMNCTVYNKDNKVAAQFDDQHFGVYYEYNNKEQLVRKSIETERGLKTLQEQQYNTPLINR